MRHHADNFTLCGKDFKHGMNSAPNSWDRNIAFPDHCEKALVLFLKRSRTYDFLIFDFQKER